MVGWLGGWDSLCLRCWEFWSIGGPRRNSKTQRSESKQTGNRTGRYPQRLERMADSRCVPCPAKRASVPSVVKTRHSTATRIFRIEFSKCDNCTKQHIFPLKTATSLGCLPNFPFRFQCLARNEAPSPGDRRTADKSHGGCCGAERELADRRRNQKLQPQCDVQAPQVL